MPFNRVSQVLRTVAGVVLVCVTVAVPRAYGEAPAGRRYALTAWAAEKGQPPGDVFAITQDSDGYLWLGTPSGLFRFDGTRFTAWPGGDPASLLPAGPVHALVGSPDGGLWVGFGGGGGVVHLDRGDVVRYTAADGAPSGVTDMIQDRRGTIWVASRRGLYQFADGRWTLLGPDAGLEPAEVFSLHEDRNGRLWVGTARGIYQRAATQFELVDRSATNVQSLTSDQSGAIWISDPNMMVARLGSADAVTYAPDIRLPSGAWRLLRDRAGQLWAATFGGGLMRIANPLDRQAVIEHFEYEHRLAGSPRALYEDRDGNIWVGMRGGLLRLSETSFATVEPLEGRTNEGVRTAAVGKDGSVWVATGHALNRFTPTGRTAYALSQTMALHTDRHGALWVSAARQLGRWSDGQLIAEPVPETVRASRVMAMASDAADRMWLCTSLRGALAWDGSTITAFDRDTARPTRACQSIHVDSQDRVWVGFLSGGAAVRDKETVQRFSVEHGLPAGTVLAILEDRSGTIWLSTSTGVARYRNGRFTAITATNAPVVDLVPVLVEDRDGYIWVGVNSGAGIMRFHPSEVDKVAGNRSHQIEYALYDESDGMQQGSQTWQSGVGAVRGGDGQLWVATGLGMTVIDPARLPAVRRPLPPRIEEVTVDGRRLSPLHDLELPPGTSTLRIDYGTVSLSSASKVRFRYMLDGKDDQWVYAGNRREATYSNIAPGDYRFRVSTTVDGRWTEAGLWAFSVASPFHRTPAFAGVAVLGLAVTIASAWWFRLRAVRKQYALVFAERARLSREIHDTLLQSLAAIGMELEAIASQLEPAHEPARDGLRRLRRQVGHCLRDARESILELRRNTVLKPRDLMDLLRALADNTTTTKGVAVAFSCSGRARQGPDEVDLQLFRIAQEAVNNAVRHGHPTRVAIALAYEPKQVVLTVADDGCGFTPPDGEDPALATGEHLGLLTMRERAARVRGRLEIRSELGGGATVVATVPLPGGLRES
jgi:signal transduction histidine kinase/ligand-binding sensor domain-containing protein